MSKASGAWRRSCPLPLSIALLAGVLIAPAFAQDASEPTPAPAPRTKTKRKKPAPLPAEPQPDPATLPVGVQDMLNRRDASGKIQVAPQAAPAPAPPGTQTPPKPNKKRPLGNADFGAPPAEVVRAENEKKAVEANAPAAAPMTDAGAAPSAPATTPEDEWRRRIRAAREQLAKLQNDLANLRNADNEDLQSINRTLLQLTDLGAMIKKLEEEGKLRQFLEIPK